MTMWGLFISTDYPGSMSDRLKSLYNDREHLRTNVYIHQTQRFSYLKLSVVLPVTCELVDLLEQLLDVIFHLFNLSGVSALSL